MLMSINFAVATIVVYKMQKKLFLTNYGQEATGRLRDSNLMLQKKLSS